MDILTIIFALFLALLALALHAKIPKCYWYQIKQLWSPKDIQPLNKGFKNKHINSFNLIRNYLHNASNSVPLTERQANDLNQKIGKYYPKSLPDTITILPKRPQFNEYKHFFSNCYYTENDVVSYDYKPKERKICKREQRFFVSFAHLKGNPLEVHVFPQNCFWWLLILYTGFMTFLFKLFNYIWLCIRFSWIICSLSISILRFFCKSILSIKAGIDQLRYLISRVF